MSDKPILFSAAMVRAIIAGNKTQTRRITKQQPPRPDNVIMPLSWWTKHAVGDRLWVRETLRFDWTGVVGGAWRYYSDKALVQSGSGRTLETPTPTRWPAGVAASIFMPRWASRITLEVTEVRVERLQSISEEDAKSEGLRCLSKDGGRVYKWGIPDKDGLPGNDDDGWHWPMWCVGHKPAFAQLWESINGPGSWEANPWICAISFTVEHRNIDAPSRALAMEGAR